MRITIAVFLVALICAPIHADEEPSISHLPAAVQDRIREWKGEGEVKAIKTRKQADGSNHYEVNYKERGDEKYVIFAEDGLVISEGGGGKGGKGKDKEKKDKENKGNKRDKDEEKREKDDDDNGTVSPTPRPRGNIPSDQPNTTTRPNAPRTRPNTTDPVARPNTTSRPSGDVRWGGGQTKYVYWDNLPEPVRTAAKAQEAQHGSVNTRALRMTTSGANSIYHIPYERASMAFTPTGAVAVTAANAGGPMRQVSWDAVPEAVRKATETVAATEGGRNTRTVFSQSERGKTLYHVLFEGKNSVVAFSTDGARQDPVSYWR
jgi:hypothetical protein